MENQNIRKPKSKFFFFIIPCIIAIIFYLVISEYLQNSDSGFNFYESVIKSKNNSILSIATVDEIPAEFFPAHLLYLHNKKDGFIKISIHNPSLIDQYYVISYGFSELGELINKHVTVKSQEVNEFLISPFSHKLLEINSPVNFSLLLKITDSNMNVIFYKEWITRVNSYDEIPWLINGNDYSFLIGSWVTPKNRYVENLIGKVSKEYGGNVKQPRSMNDVEFDKLVKSVFNVIRDEGITYINSTISFGEGYTQRVRMPEASLKNKTANCIDGAVLFASIFENIDLRPFIVIVPGHAFIGVARENDLENKIFIETTLLGRSKIESLLSLERTYTAAKRKGSISYSNAQRNNVASKKYKFKVIDIYQWRSKGVLPMN